MDLPQYKILAADINQHALLTIDCPSCRILAQIPYPESISPLDIATAPDGKKAYMPANDNTTGKGCLFVLNLAAHSLYQLPVDIPLIQQFALTPSGTTAYLIDNNNTLFQLDTASLNLTVWGCPGINSTCTGIAATDTGLYTIWEDRDGGTLLCLDNAGRLDHECTFSAIPTSITVAPSKNLIITFTSTQQSGEGVLIVDNATENTNDPFVITTLCPKDFLSHRNYPIHASLSSDGTLAYIVNEDSASISIIDMKNHAVTGHIIVGRAISRLYLLPGNTFALATSSLFADLILIDLVNEKVLSTTMPPNELYPHIALLPD